MFLVSVSTMDIDRKEKGERCFNQIISALELLRKNNFSDEEIKTFQVMIDLFFQDWVKFWDKKSTSNCINMLQSGNVYELLFHWRNICKHNQ